MKVLKITDKVYEYYKEYVNNNKKISKDQAARKLTRNVILAKEVRLRETKKRLLGYKLYFYGNLDILTKWGKVVHIQNIKGGKRKCGWYKDMKKYHQLTKELGIVD